MTPAKTLDVQLHFWGRMKELGIFVCFAGVMDSPQRWEVIRRAIVKFDLADVLRDKRETFAQGFNRATGKPLGEKYAG